VFLMPAAGAHTSHPTVATAEDPPFKRQRTAPPALRAAVASSKGRKLTLEDVTVIAPALEGDGALSFYAVLDGHGGRDCAEYAAERLPSLIDERLRGVHESVAIKEAMKVAYATCEHEVLERANAKSWDDGCCVVGLLIDRRCTPARAYVANLGDSRAVACVEPPEAAVRAVALTKDQTASDPKEKRRIEANGGFVENGRVCGMLEVSRSLGDRKLKARPKGSGLSASPEVTSFAIGPEQRFVLLACDGFWKAWTALQAVEALHAALPKMDSRRAALAAKVDDPEHAASLTKEAFAALLKEREGASEEGCLREMVLEAVHVRHAKDNVTALVVRMPDAVAERPMN